MSSISTKSRTLLATIDDLRQHGSAQLGRVDKRSYQTLYNEMQRVAKTHKVAEPILALGLQFKKELRTPLERENGWAYPVLEKEWGYFKIALSELCEPFPEIYVVDGSKYSLSCI